MEVLAFAAFAVGVVLYIAVFAALFLVLLVAAVALSREMWMLLLRRTRE